MRSDATDPSGPALSRRGLMRSTAAGVGGLAAGGTAVQLGAVGSASASLVDCSTIVSGAGAAAGGAIGGPSGAIAGGVLAYNVRDSFCGSSVDRSAEQQEADWENWVEIYNRAREGQLLDENQLSSSRRDAGGMRQMGLVDAMVAAANEAQTGADKATGKQAALDAANAQLTKTFQGFWNHWELRIGQYEGDVTFIRSSDFATSADDVLRQWGEVSETWGAPGNLNESNVNDLTVTLPDDAEITISGRNDVLTDGPVHCQTPAPSHESTILFEGNDAHDWETGYTDPAVQEPDPSIFSAVDGSEVDTSDFAGNVRYPDVSQFYDTLAELEEVQSNTISQVEDLVDQHWDALVAGEIDPSQITSMAGVLDAIRDADSFREIVTGFQSQGHWVADTATVVQLTNPETGETMEVDGQFSFNRSSEPDPLPIGTEVDPSTMPGDLYFAYNVTDSGEVVGANFTVAKQPFTIIDAESGASEISWTRNAIAESDVSVQDIRNVLEDIEDSRQDAEQARQDINVDAGFSLGDALGGVGSWVTYAAVGVVGLLGWSFLSSDD